ncbi:MAG: anaerobic sulfite reductase subunit AsrB [Defluviitaleaceae bacterium]|nr:anaerobic sulfite reductase subunit AsrB [Defluviitaleaceae bacterium]
MCDRNEYIPSAYEIKDVVKQTDAEYTFRVAYSADVKPGQFFEVSIPKFGESPISISEIGPDYIDLTIRKVGRVTSEIFTYTGGDKLFMRGPYGNGFDLDVFKGKELIVAAGGTGVSPVKPVIDYFAANPGEVTSCKVLLGYKSQQDILFKNSLANWTSSLDVSLTLDRAEEGYGGRVGFVSALVPGLDIANPPEAQVIVVGPPAMITSTAKEFLNRGIAISNIWISLERRMCCGIGKCGHCRINDQYVCLDGPVFNYEKGVNLVD